jgi:hypothetical protein
MPLAGGIYGNPADKESVMDTRHRNYYRSTRSYADRTSPLYLVRDVSDGSWTVETRNRHGWNVLYRSENIELCRVYARAASRKLIEDARAQVRFD